jgi:hypothetical protein
MRGPNAQPQPILDPSASFSAPIPIRCHVVPFQLHHPFHYKLVIPISYLLPSHPKHPNTAIKQEKPFPRQSRCEFCMRRYAVAWVCYSVCISRRHKRLAPSPEEPCDVILEQPRCVEKSRTIVMIATQCQNPSRKLLMLHHEGVIRSRIRCVVLHQLLSALQLEGPSSSATGCLFEWIADHYNDYSVVLPVPLSASCISPRCASCSAGQASS